MTQTRVALDHILIPSRERDAAAKLLASILDVEWAPAGSGPFAAVYVNSGLTIDFDEWREDFTKGHFCFRVDDDGFDRALQRIEAAGIPYRSSPHGPDDRRINTAGGGKVVYWNEPDGHVWELLTKSYARMER